MRIERTVERGGEADIDRARRQLLAGVPVSERRLELAGVSTAVLEGGDGPPVVLLHGQGGWAGVWLPAIAGLAGSHRVVAPDLPGLGASRATEGPPGAETALAWLGELIDQTCATPPVLAGVSLGGSIAARFAAAHPDRLAGLVLISMGGLVGKVRLRPRMLLALVRHNLRPSERTALAMLRQVSVDVERARDRMGPRWEPFRSYSLVLSRSRGQPPTAARARSAPDPAGGAGPYRRPDHPHLGAAGPGDAAGDRRGGQRPLRLAPSGGRGRRPLPEHGPAGGVPGGAAGGARPMIDCAVVGAGPAGLAASAALTDRQVEHVVLERGRAGESWRSQRWDSFRLNTVGWMNRLLGDQPADAYATGLQVVRRLERLAAACPVRDGAEVTGWSR